MKPHTFISKIASQNLPTEYVIGSDLLSKLEALAYFKTHVYDSFILICDENTQKLFVGEVIASLKKTSRKVTLSVVPVGEKAKDLKKIHSYLSPMLKVGITINSAVVSLGGGVVSDIGGFIASILLRGIDSVYIPTTLLAQIDAAIGGKTGVDFWGQGNLMYKNMIGTFHQPTLVISDVNTLTTLPKREIVSGLGEMVKYYVGWEKPNVAELIAIKDTLTLKTPREWPKDSPEVEELKKTILICQRLKALVVEKDPFESTGERQKLNLGHTIGHAIESATKGKLSHGEAVAIGLVGTAKLSVAMKMLAPQKAQEIVDTVKMLGLPTQAKQVNTNDVLQAMEMDKKGDSFVLIKDIGEIQSGIKIDSALVEKVVKEMCR